MKKQKHNILTKLIIENDIKFKYPEINGLYWDIETFNTSHFDRPLYD